MQKISTSPNPTGELDRRQRGAHRPLGRQLRRRGRALQVVRERQDLGGVHGGRGRAGQVRAVLGVCRRRHDR